ncbi:GNAT family N-acetyltransferase [Pseudophaeobacter leonis]|uniref:GNAT family N-acetyltransferase n=1 Tax=Pseudophaeobacter leonis TaxID=1144477 RepID=UPI0009F6B7A0|nr:GNAT family protein [Pseudophaeobacter leonis]
MCLSLCPVASDAFDLVRHIAVQPDQILFSGTVAQAFQTKEDGVDFHAILINETAIGFFKIDRCYGIAKDNELGLRGFMIDQRHQGKGHATSALRALPDYLRPPYPDQTSLLLTVDIQNVAAIACYRKSGFLNTGQLYFGGFSGPQQVMRLPLLAA